MCPYRQLWVHHGNITDKRPEDVVLDVVLETLNNGALGRLRSSSSEPTISTGGCWRRCRSRINHCEKGVVNVYHTGFTGEASATRNLYGDSCNVDGDCCMFVMSSVQAWRSSPNKKFIPVTLQNISSKPLQPALRQSTFCV